MAGGKRDGVDNGGRAVIVLAAVVPLAEFEALESLESIAELAGARVELELVDNEEEIVGAESVWIEMLVLGVHHTEVPGLVVLAVVAAGYGHQESYEDEAAPAGIGIVCAASCRSRRRALGAPALPTSASTAGARHATNSNVFMSYRGKDKVCLVIFRPRAPYWGRGARCRREAQRLVLRDRREVCPEKGRLQ